MRYAALRGSAKRLTAALQCVVRARSRRSWRGAAICALVMGAFAPAVQAQSAPAIVRLSVADYRSYLPETHSVRQALRDFALAAGQKSRGQLRVDVLNGTVAGSPSEQINAVRQGKPGAPAIMLVAATGLADLQKDFALFDLPYAVRDAQQADDIVEGATGQALLSSLSPHGLEGLAWMENGFRQLVTTDAVIRSADDLRGLRIRTLPSATSIDTFRAWGAQPVAIAAARVREALERGEVQGQEGFVSNLLQGRMAEVQKHLWLTQHSYGAQVLVARSEAWRALTDEQKDWLKDAALEAARQQRKRAREEDLQALKSLEAAGMQVHRLAPDITSALADATQPMRLKAQPLQGAER